MQNNESSKLENQNVPMSKRVTIYRYLALIGHIGLLGWLSIWYLLLDDVHEYSNTFVMVVYILPLVLPLHGIIKAKPYTHAWSCFVVLWYFLHSLTTMYAESDYIIHASIELVFASIMFVGCSMFARFRGQELGTGLPKLSKVMAEEKAMFERVNEQK